MCVLYTCSIRINQTDSEDPRWRSHYSLCKVMKYLLPLSLMIWFPLAASWYHQCGVDHLCHHVYHWIPDLGERRDHLDDPVDPVETSDHPDCLPHSDFLLYAVTSLWLYPLHQKITSQWEQWTPTINTSWWTNPGCWHTDCWREHW